MTTDLNSLGRRSTEWRVRRDLSTDPGWVTTKLAEEVGEVARAVVGEYEERAGRGDVVQEIAQSIIVLCSLATITHPEADLDAAIASEMKRLGA